MSQLLVACSGVSHLEKADVKQPWKVEKQAQSTAGYDSCSLVSNPENFSSSYGISPIKILVEQDGLVRLQSSNDAFDLKALDQIGIRVDENAPVLKPSKDTTPQSLIFNEAASNKLLKQMEAGATVRVQVALLPKRELLSGAYSLTGFSDTYLEYKICRVFARDEAKKEME